jgi:prevent-host-death family protein
MQIVNLHEAKANLSKLIDAVGEGEDVILTKAGKPAARLVLMQLAKTVRKPGASKGKIRVAPDFDAALPDLLVAALMGR